MIALTLAVRKASRRSAAIATVHCCHATIGLGRCPTTATDPLRAASSSSRRARVLPLAFTPEPREDTMLKHKTALITGSTSGIGLGIAEAFAAAGANVILNGFGAAAEIEAIRALLAALPGATLPYHCAHFPQPPST